MVDEDGQPNPRFNWRDRAVREVDELVGLCKGIVADGAVNESEADFIAQWLRSNVNSREIWPCSVLYPRISKMLADGTLSSEEERELLSLLMRVAGGNPEGLKAHSLTAGLPLDDPIPAVVIPGNTFCFTGKMISGPRKECEAHVIQRGGVVAEAITQGLSFLVIGTVGSRDWLHSTFGRKIEKAVTYRDRGGGLKIVSEEQFVKALD